MKISSLFSMFSGTLFQLAAVLTATLLSISDGMHYGWTAPVIPILLSEDTPIPTTKSQAELLEIMIIIGSFIGIPFTIYLVDKIGRKKSLLLSSALSLLCWVIIGSARQIEYIFAARFFVGMAGDMTFVAAPMYVAEIASEKIRGFLSSIIYLAIVVGILIIYSVAPFVPFYVPAVIGGLLTLTELIVFSFMPESPYYLLYKENREEAKKSLIRFRQSTEVNKELEDIEQAVQRQKKEKGRPQDLVLVKSNRKAILIITILNGTQHFSGITVIVMNIHLILEAAGTVYISASSASIMFSVIMLVAALTASFSIDKFGRRVLLITSCILSGISLLTIAIYFTLKNNEVNVVSVSWIPITAVMMYAAVFRFGLGLVPIVMTAELFPAKLKALGMTLADTMYLIFALGSVQTYQILTTYGLHVPFYVYSSVCFVSTLVTVFFIPETKGKTLDEIQFILKGETPPKEVI